MQGVCPYRCHGVCDCSGVPPAGARAFKRSKSCQRPRIKLAKIVADPIGMEVRVGGRICPWSILVGCMSDRNISLGWLAVSGTRDDVTI